MSRSRRASSVRSHQHQPDVDQTGVATVEAMDELSEYEMEVSGVICKRALVITDTAVSTMQPFIVVHVVLKIQISVQPLVPYRGLYRGCNSR